MSDAGVAFDEVGDENLPRKHTVLELGLGLNLVEDEDGQRGLDGVATVVPEMYVPGTTALCMSVMAMWTDLLAGVLCGFFLEPRVPVTLDLAVDFVRPPVDLTEVHGTARMIKTGRQVLNVGLEYTVNGETLAIGTAGFMPVPDASLTLPHTSTAIVEHHTGEGRLSKPYFERVGIARRSPGVSTLAKTAATTNASNTINGGLVVAAVEDAVLSTAAPGEVMGSLLLRYLRPLRVGPAVARATRVGDTARVEVTDEGSDDRLGILATTRLIRL